MQYALYDIYVLIVYVYIFTLGYITFNQNISVQSLFQPTITSANTHPRWRGYIINIVKLYQHIYFIKPITASDLLSNHYILFSTIYAYHLQLMQIH